jgi:hypothetical protein
MLERTCNSPILSYTPKSILMPMFEMLATDVVLLVDTWAFFDFSIFGAVFGREFLGHTVRQQLPRHIHNVKLFHVSSLMLLSR